jgi:uncharacterized protein (TIGR03000 family)
MSLRSIFFAAATCLAAALFPVTAEAAHGHGGGFHGGGGWHGGGWHGGGWHGGGWRGGWGGDRSGYWGGLGYRNYGWRGYGWGGWPLYSSYAWSYPGYSYGLGYPYYGVNYYDYTPQYYDYAPGVYGSAYYSPAITTVQQSAPTVVQDNSVQITVRVPPDAMVWFDDYQTQQTGATREFQSPPLTLGRDYTYTVHARWMENGRQVDRSRTIHVPAGAVLNVDMMQSQSGDRTEVDGSVTR